MEEEFVMPGYFELLSMADFGAAPISVLDYVKSSGVTGLLAILAVGVAWLFLVLGLTLRSRGVLSVSILAALGAMLVGWGGTYMGYVSMAQVVESARTAPREADLVGAATRMLFSGVAPSVGAFLPLLLAMAVAPFMGRKSE